MNEDFRYIAAIAEHGSINKAARAMNISQPGLSRRLKRIEGQLGTELFERSSTPLRPTAPGEVYIRYAHQALAAEDRMRRDFRNAAMRKRTRLRIGVSMSRANSLLAAPVVAFYEACHGCTIELREMVNLEQLHDLFVNDTIDFAVLTPIAPDPSQYEIELLCREQLVVATSREFEIPQLRGASKASLSSLEGIPFVLPTCGPYFDPLIDRMIERSRAHLDISIRDCSPELALKIVDDGLGIAIVPSTSLVGRYDVRAFDLEDATAGNALRYIRRGDRPRSEEEQLFMRILRDSLSGEPLFVRHDLAHSSTSPSGIAAPN